MPKRVFFSFHYQDISDFRGNVVRQHWLTKPDREEAGYFDASIWEAARTQGDVALKRLINGALENTSTTCVLIGSETYARPWVRYELAKSFVRGNKIIGVHINSIAGKDRRTKLAGQNPLRYLCIQVPAHGDVGTLLEWNGASWVEYSRVDGTSRVKLAIPEWARGRSLALDEFCRTYDWAADDGYNQFANWIA